MDAASAEVEDTDSPAVHTPPQASHVSSDLNPYAKPFIPRLSTFQTPHLSTASASPASSWSAPSPSPAVSVSASSWFPIVSGSQCTSASPATLLQRCVEQTPYPPPSVAALQLVTAVASTDLNQFHLLLNLREFTQVDLDLVLRVLVADPEIGNSTRREYIHLVELLPPHLRPCRAAVRLRAQTRGHVVECHRGCATTNLCSSARRKCRVHEFVQALCHSSHVNVDVSVDCDIKTPALLAASRAESLVLRALIQNGADLTVTNVYCKDALQLLLEAELAPYTVSVAADLLAGGVDPNRECGELSATDLCLSLAFPMYQHEVCSAYYPLLRCLLSAGGNANHPYIEDYGSSINKTALVHVTERRDYDAMRLLLRHGADANAACTFHRLRHYYDSESPDDENFAEEPREATPLMFAVRECDVTASRLLMTHGADVMARDACGHSVLHYAAFRDGAYDGWIKFRDTPEALLLFRHLLRRGADVDAVNHTGASPLTFALSAESNDLLLMLLQENAAVDSYSRDESESGRMFRSRLGHAARLGLVDWAVKLNNLPAVVMLVSAGAPCGLRELLTWHMQCPAELSDAYPSIDLLHCGDCEKCDEHADTVRHVYTLARSAVEYLETLLTGPPTLKNLTRNVIRKHIPPPFVSNLGTLPLPDRVKDFIAFRDPSLMDLLKVPFGQHLRHGPCDRICWIVEHSQHIEESMARSGDEESVSEFCSTMRPDLESVSYL